VSQPTTNQHIYSHLLNEFLNFSLPDGVVLGPIGYAKLAGEPMGWAATIGGTIAAAAGGAAAAAVANALDSVGAVDTHRCKTEAIAADVTKM
jgi:hypothetical protein